MHTFFWYNLEQKCPSNPEMIAMLCALFDRFLCHTLSFNHVFQTFYVWHVFGINFISF